MLIMLHLVVEKQTLFPTPRKLPQLEEDRNKFVHSLSWWNRAKEQLRGKSANHYQSNFSVSNLIVLRKKLCNTQALEMLKVEYVIKQWFELASKLLRYVRGIWDFDVLGINIQHYIRIMFNCIKIFSQIGWKCDQCTKCMIWKFI